MRRSVPRTWAKWPLGRSRQVHRAHVLTGHCAGSRGAGALGTHGASRLERPKRVSRRGRERPWERRFHRGPACRAAPAADAGPPGDVGTPGTLGAAAAWTPRGALHLGARRGDILVSLSWHSSPTTITRLGASLSVSRADGGAVCTRREQGRPVNGSGGRGARRAREISSPPFLPLTQRPAFPVTQAGSLHFRRHVACTSFGGRGHLVLPLVLPVPAETRGPGSAQWSLVARREPLPRESPGHQPWGDVSQ